MSLSQSASKSEVKAAPIIISLLIGGFIGIFSEMSLNVALSSLIKELHVSTDVIQWLTTGYMLIISILIPVSALLIQTFTTRILFIASITFFTVGTLVAGLAGNFAILLSGRCVQAIGTGLLIPLMFNTILTITPPEKRGARMGIIGLVMMFSPAIAPTLAGLILNNLNWHWLFWVLVPFLILALIFGSFNMKNVTPITKTKIDWLSILLSTIGFGGIVYGFSASGQGSGAWGNPNTFLPLAIGIVGVALFIWRQLVIAQPILNLQPFKYPMFTVGLILLLVSMMTIFSFIFLMPMYLQNGLALSSFAAGLILLPSGLLNGVMSPVTGRLFDQFGPRWLVISGFVIAGIFIWLLTGLTTTTSPGLVILLNCCLMIGMSMVIMPAQTNGLNQLPRQLYPHGSAIMNTLQQLAGAVATALCASILSSGSRTYLESPSAGSNQSLKVAAVAFTHGIHNGFIFTFVLTLIGFFVSLFIKKAVHTS